MSRFQTLLILVGLAVVMAVGGFLLFDEGGDPLMVFDPNVGSTSGDPEVALATGDEEPSDAAGEREEVTEVTAPDSASDLDPELAAEMAGFKGRVLHHDGKPAAGTRVVLYRGDLGGLLGEVADWMSDDTIDPDVDAGDATTGDDGRFTIRGVWPRGVYLLHAGVDSDNPTPQIVERTPGNREIIDLGDIYLRNGASVSGVVLDSDGLPRPGALVRVTDLPMQLLQMVPLERFDPEGAVVIQERRTSMVLDMPGWVKRRFDELPIPSATTDREGKFRVTGIEPGGNVLVVTASDHLSLLKPGFRLDPGQHEDAGTLELRGGEEVFGSVKDQRGQPVASAEVLIAQGGAVSEVSFARRSIRANEQGEFSAAGFRNGKVVGAARRNPGSPWVVGEPQPVLRDLDIVLPAALRLTVKLVSRPGRPIENPDFRLLPGRKGNGAVELAWFGLSEEVSLDDRVTRTEDGRYRFDDLAAGHYTLLVRCAGHAIRQAQIQLHEDVEQTIELDKGASVAVLVQDREERPIRAAAIYMELRGRGRVADMPLPLGRTAADGRVFTGQVPPGEVQIMAHHPKYGWIHEFSEVPGNDIVLTFDTPGVLEGVLTENGREPEIGKWTIVAHRILDNGRHADELPRMTVADGDGNFVLRGLQPSRYRLEVMESFGRFTSPGTFVKQMMMQQFFDSNSQEVTIHAGRTARCTIDAHRQNEVVEGPSARVGGTVLVDGAPAEGMMLTGWAPQGRISAVVDAAGRFDLGQVREGILYLRLVDPSEADLINRGALWTRNVKVVEDENQNLDIALQTASISGYVTDASGAPVGGATVRISGTIHSEGEKQRASANFRAITDERGYYSAGRLPGGSYDIRATHDQLGIGKTGPLDVRTGARQADVRLRATVSVSGRVDMTVFEKPTSHVWLAFLSRADGNQAGWTPVQKDGSFKAERLVPGEYGGQAWVTYEGERESHEFELDGVLQVGTRDMSDVSIRLVEKVREPKPQAATAEKK